MQCIFCCAFFLVANAVLSPRRRRDLLCPDHPGDAVRPTERPPSPLPRPRPRTDTPSAAPWCALALKVHLSGVSHSKMPPTSGPSIGPRTLASAAASPGAGVGAVMDVDAGVSTGAGASTSERAGGRRDGRERRRLDACARRRLDGCGCLDRCGRLGGRWARSKERGWCSRQLVGSRLPGRRKRRPSNKIIKCILNACDRV